jgi:hypothetical protein
LVLALAAILTLHRGSAWAIALTWLFAAATLYDLIDSTIIGLGCGSKMKLVRGTKLTMLCSRRCEQAASEQ